MGAPGLAETSDVDRQEQHGSRKYDLRLYAAMQDHYTMYTASMLFAKS